MRQLLCSMFIVCSLTVLLVSRTHAGLSLLPQPVRVSQQEGYFEINSSTVICAQNDADLTARHLKRIFSFSMGFELEIRAKKEVSNAILLNMRPDLMTDLGSEGYQLLVTSKTVTINAPTLKGLFYGTVTLCQLLPADIYSQIRSNVLHWQVPCVRIEDFPRFKWRGMHLDVSRHFMPKDFVMKYIDLIAMHKMNVLHWHLTDDQGWRIEIKKYPKLTKVGAWRKETIKGHASRSKEYDRKPHGGFYTQDDVREIVAYAAQRHVTVVPEIEMPGHCQAALAAYPELGNTQQQLPVSTKWGVNYNVYNVNEKTILFLQDVLTEILELFPSEFIHIGGDEVPKKQWQASKEAQARMKALGLKDEHELQSWFIKRMDVFLAEHGRRLIGWDEILEGGLAPGATVMSWRGVKGGIAAAQANHDVVMASNSHLYFDYYQGDPKNEPLAIGGFLPIRKVYSFNPIPVDFTEEQARHILGAQGQVWTEYIPNPQQAEYMALPRMCALAEVVWTPDAQKDYNDFIDRLGGHLKRLDQLNVNYRPLDPEPIVIGKWKSGQTTEEYKLQGWDISEFINQVGSYDITFRYLSGTHRLDVKWAELRAGKNVLARDDHWGTTGGRNQNTVYHFELKQLPADKIYFVAMVRSDGGNDSNGEITLRKN